MVAGYPREGELVTTPKRELDAYTLRWVARKIARTFCECEDCSDINNNVIKLGKELAEKATSVSRALTKKPRKAK